MANNPLPALRAALAEMEALRAQAKVPRVQLTLDRELQILRAEVTFQEELERQTQQIDNTAPMDTDTAPKPVEPVPRPIAPANVSAAPSLIASSSRGLVKVPADITSYGWDQSATYVKVYLTVKDCGPGFSPAHCKLDVATKQFALLCDCPSGKLYRLSVADLGGPVDSVGSSVKAKADGSVTVVLKKANSSTWSDLKVKEDKFKAPKYDKNEDPQAGLMSLMKNMYDEGDDDMKRTISKAFYESQAGKKSSMDV